jgi:predicted nucleic acid-binding Zn ribbon protein
MNRCKGCGAPLAAGHVFCSAQCENDYMHEDMDIHDTVAEQRGER